MNRLSLEPLVKPHEYHRAARMTAEQRRRERDPFRLAGELLERLDRAEPESRARTEEAFADMAIARADLLASPLYAGDDDAAYRRLQAITDARDHRQRAREIRERAGK